MRSVPAIFEDETIKSPVVLSRETCVLVIFPDRRPAPGILSNKIISFPFGSPKYDGPVAVLVVCPDEPDMSIREKYVETVLCMWNRYLPGWIEIYNASDHGNDLAELKRHQGRMQELGELVKIETRLIDMSSNIDRAPIPF